MDTICKDYAILYKGLDHLHIWVSAGSWNQSPAVTRDNWVFGESKLYADFSAVRRGQHP